MVCPSHDSAEAQLFFTFHPVAPGRFIVCRNDGFHTVVEVDADPFELVLLRSAALIADDFHTLASSAQALETAVLQRVAVHRTPDGHAVVAIDVLFFAAPESAPSLSKLWAALEQLRAKTAALPGVLHVGVNVVYSRTKPFPQDRPAPKGDGIPPTPTLN